MFMLTNCLYYLQGDFIVVENEHFSASVDSLGRVGSLYLAEQSL